MQLRKIQRPLAAFSVDVNWHSCSQNVVAVGLCWVRTGRRWKTDHEWFTGSIDSENDQTCVKWYLLATDDCGCVFSWSHGRCVLWSVVGGNVVIRLNVLLSVLQCSRWHRWHRWQWQWSQRYCDWSTCSVTTAIMWLDSVSKRTTTDSCDNVVQVCDNYRYGVRCDRLHRGVAWHPGVRRTIISWCHIRIHPHLGHWPCSSTDMAKSLFYSSSRNIHNLMTISMLKTWVMLVCMLNLTTLLFINLFAGGQMVWSSCDVKVSSFHSAWKRFHVLIALHQLAFRIRLTMDTAYVVCVCACVCCANVYCFFTFIYFYFLHLLQINVFMYCICKQRPSKECRMQMLQYSLLISEWLKNLFLLIYAYISGH